MFELGASKVRRPRVRVSVEGEALSGIVEASVTSNDWRAADKFSFVLAVGPDSERGPAWWADADRPEVEISFGMAPAGGGEPAWESAIVGRVDEVSVDWEEGTVTVEGRDYTADLIELALVESFQNETVAQVVRKLAERAGLTADVEGGDEILGNYRQRDHVRGTGAEFSRATNAFDLLAWMAEQAGASFWVEGRTLHFRRVPEPSAADALVVRRVPPTVQRGGPGTAVLYGGAFPALDLKTTESKDLARDIEVVVESWNSRLGRLVRAVARGSAARVGGGRGRARASTTAEDDPILSQIPGYRSPGSRGGGGADPVLSQIPGFRAPSARRARAASATAAPSRVSGSFRRERYTPPDLTQEQAIRYAQQRLRELTAHQKAISFRMPGELTLKPRKALRLEGTETSWDQVYFVEEVERTLSGKGFVQEVRAKNSAPRTTHEAQGENAEETVAAAAAADRGEAPAGDATAAD